MNREDRKAARAAVKQIQRDAKANHKAAKQAGTILEIGMPLSAKIIVDMAAGTIAYKGEKIALAGAKATFDDTTSRRITATRLVTTGVFALAARKKSGKGYVTVESSNGAIMMELAKEHIRHGARFATDINNAARKYDAANGVGQAVQSDSPSEPSSDVLTAIQRLGDLRDSGVITEAEFDSKKAELLARL